MYFMVHTKRWNESKPAETTTNYPHFAKPVEITHFIYIQI